MYIKTLVFVSLLFSALFIQPAYALTLDVQDPSNVPAEVIRVNINQASAEQLAAVLHGVGLSRAQAIVELRDNLGEFAHLDELLQVRGLSVRILEMNQHRIEL